MVLVPLLENASLEEDEKIPVYDGCYFF